jgi:hypothetical protein
MIDFNREGAEGCKQKMEDGRWMRDEEIGGLGIEEFGDCRP